MTGPAEPRPSAALEARLCWLPSLGVLRQSEALGLRGAEPNSNRARCLSQRDSYVPALKRCVKSRSERFGPDRKRGKKHTRAEG